MDEGLLADLSSVCAGENHRFNCRECGEVVEHFEQLLQHFQTRHSESESMSEIDTSVVVCLRCKTLFHKQVFLAQLMKEAGKPEDAEEAVATNTKVDSPGKPATSKTNETKLGDDDEVAGAAEASLLPTGQLEEILPETSGEDGSSADSVRKSNEDFWSSMQYEDISDYENIDDDDDDIMIIHCSPPSEIKTALPSATGDVALKVSDHTDLNLESDETPEITISSDSEDMDIIEIDCSPPSEIRTAFPSTVCDLALKGSDQNDLNLESDETPVHENPEITLSSDSDNEDLIEIDCSPPSEIRTALPSAIGDVALRVSDQNDLNLLESDAQDAPVYEGHEITISSVGDSECSDGRATKTGWMETHHHIALLTFSKPTGERSSQMCLREAESVKDVFKSVAPYCRMIRIFRELLDVHGIILRFMQIISQRSSTKSISSSSDPPTRATITDIQILHDSPHYIVVDKRYDVIINDEDKTVPVTVETQLIRLYPDLVNSRLPMSFYFCHRLDYATSGILCIAKTKRSCSAAVEEFQSRKAIKYYLAIVRGHISQETLTVSEGVGEDIRELQGNHRMAIESSPYCVKKARGARTHLAILEKGICYDYPATKVLLRPITGRRHQLRVHCSSLGHTIVGDFTYSNRKDVQPYRMFLHAYRLVLPSKYESLDVTTSEDPFANINSSWTSVQTVMTVEEAMGRLCKL